MKTKRNYLDSLNAGRRRRSNTSLDDISDTLSALEDKLAANNPRGASRVASPRQSPGLADRPARNPSANPALPRSGSFAGSQTASYQAGDRASARSEGYASIHRISDELRALRNDLQRELNSGIKKEFESLRDLLASMYAEAGSSRAGSALMPELDRIADAVETLSARGDHGDVRELRAEIEILKGAINDLAREDSVQSLKTRWTDFDRRWDTIENSLHRNSDFDQTQHRAIAALNTRLDSIMDAVATLPESLSVRSLDEKIRILGEAIDHVSDRPSLSSNMLGAVEDRLDEISRAIAATTSAPVAFDTSSIERIEARIASLAKQINEVVEPAPGFVTHLQELSDRIDAIANRAEMPNEAIERVAKQLAVITDHLEASQPPADLNVLLHGVEERILSLSDTLQRSTDDVAARSQQMFGELESRLEDLAARFDAQSSSGAGSAAILSDLETRFDQLAARLDADTARSETTLRSTFDDRFRELENQLSQERATGDGTASASTDAIEARLDALAEKLENQATSHAPYDEVIRNLEAQIANISSFIAGSDGRAPGLDDLSPRLDEIERALSSNHERVMEAARLAAEDAVKSASSREDSGSGAVAALAEDLKELDALARRSEERSTKTFEAIQQTLHKIVDRLETLENTRLSAPGNSPRPDSASKSSKMELDSAPAMETGEEDFLVADAVKGERIAGAPVLEKQSAANSVAPAVMSALKAGPSAGESDTDGKKKMSVLGGLTRAFSGRKEPKKDAPTEDDVTAGADEMSLSGAPEVDEKDELLEPGTGAPDLGAIMKRVREEHDNPAKRMDPDAAKADFIAAARRAAQAAAAEAKGPKGRSEKVGQNGKLAIGSLLSEKRKSLLMAAGVIMIGIAGFQLSKSFFHDKPASVAQKAPSVSQSETAKEEPSSSPADDPLAATDVQPEDTAPNNVRVVDTGKTSEAENPDPMNASVPAAMKPDLEETTTAISPSEEPSDTGNENKLSIDFGPQPLRNAVASADPKAYFEVATRYADGRGVATDLAKAAEWYAHSAEAGYAPAQYRIGNFFEKGLGVKRDIPAAKRWYEQAAEQGNVSAMHNLAVLYAMGADGAADNETAVKWFRKAAELGVKDSQFNLAILDAKGVGTPQDLVDSYKWFAVAARNGDKDAADKRDEVAKALRPEQLDKARAAADLWKPQAVNTEANSFVAPDAWQGAPEETAAIDMQKAVRNIQLILTKNGYDAGPADGVMGARTKQAIKAFQKDNGMTVTGEVDETLVRALLAKN